MNTPSKAGPSRFTSDSLVPSSLPSANLGRRGHAKQADPTSSDKFQEDWNGRIDKEVKALSGGLRELVALADIGETPSSHSNEVTSLHLKLKTSALIRSAQNIRDMAHELRLMLILSDKIDVTRSRDGEMRMLRKDAVEKRREVAQGIASMLGSSTSGKKEESGGQGKADREESPGGSHTAGVDDSEGDFEEV
ncbi:hypothetical protein P7C73_g4315, partial [Tremellales sp. Uapishka_1]